MNKFTNIESIVRNTLGIVVKYKTCTDNLVCLCPFHDNKNTPAFTIDLKYGKYFCHNPSCGEKGNSIRSLIYKLKGWSNTSIDKLFVDNLLPDKVEEYSKILEEIEDIFKDYGDYKYSKCFHPYLVDKRKIPKDIIKKFKLGYKKKYDSIVIPIFDAKNTIAGYKFRAIDPDMIRFASNRRFEKSAVLYGLNVAKNTNYGFCILVEGEFDCLAMHSIGFDNTVSPMSCSPSRKQIELLSDYFDTVFIMFDNDRAGKLGARKVINRYGHLFKKIWRYNYMFDAHSINDPDDLVKFYNSKNEINDFISEINLLTRN